MINSTLCYIENDGCYLMLYRNKKKDDPNAGKWIGVGGKFASGESADECVRREVREETGLCPHDNSADCGGLEFRYRGLVHFRSDLWEDEDMYLYTAWLDERPTDLTDELAACEEGTLEWIPKSEILGLRLWEGDRYFLERLLEEPESELESLAEASTPFEMTLRYEGETLVEVVRGE